MGGKGVLRPGKCSSSDPSPGKGPQNFRNGLASIKGHSNAPSCGEAVCPRAFRAGGGWNPPCTHRARLLAGRVTGQRDEIFEWVLGVEVWWIADGRVWEVGGGRLGQDGRGGEVQRRGWVRAPGHACGQVVGACQGAGLDPGPG